jgi:hypothetical protein
MLREGRGELGGNLEKRRRIREQCCEGRGELGEMWRRSGENGKNAGKKGKIARNVEKKKKMREQCCEGRGKLEETLKWKTRVWGK